MKKTIQLLFSLFLAISACYAQESDDMVAQPTHVIGRSFNAAGEITRELESDFTYLEDGKLLQYEFPEYAIFANYSYDGDYLTQERIIHGGGEHPYYETNLFAYENGNIQTVSHLMDNMGVSQYWVYGYYDDGRLERIDYRADDEDVFHTHWLYDYEDGGKTVVESYYTSWEIQGLLLRKKTTSRYDDSYVITSALVEDYTEAGELTSATLTHYHYTDSGLNEETVVQTLENETWVNTSITRYVRDEGDQLVEQLRGSWDGEVGDWNFTRRITFDTSEDGKTYTVSFYKKSGDAWVWDVFNRQTVLFGSFLKAQQRMINYMVYEEMNGQGNVNQIEFTLESTKEPVYLDVEDGDKTFVRAYPNPGNDQLCIDAPVEKALIRIYDTQGKLVHEQPFNYSATIHADSWAKGIYVWEIWDGFCKAACGKWIKK